MFRLSGLPISATHFFVLSASTIYHHLSGLFAATPPQATAQTLSGVSSSIPQLFSSISIPATIRCSLRRQGMQQSILQHDVNIEKSSACKRLLKFSPIAIGTLQRHYSDITAMLRHDCFVNTSGILRNNWLFGRMGSRTEQEAANNETTTGVQ